MIKAIALTAFVHGSHKMQRGDTAEFSPQTFASLAANGLLREDTGEAKQKPVQQSQRAARTPSNKKAAEPENKAAVTADAGAAGPTAPADDGDAAADA